VKGYAMFGWYSIVAPRGTPEPILVKSSDAVLKAIKDPAIGEKLKALGIEITAGGRKELDSFRREERKRVSELVRANGVSIK
jgi:tripartite-type tricarboxylate transporter receptor subunit TctC